MNRSRRAVRGLLALALALVVASCSREEAHREGEVRPPDEKAPALSLSPLPEPPAISVPQQALPGADGKLAVVAARPLGPVQGLVRPTITFSKPVKTLEVLAGESDAPPPATLEPALPGAWRWLGSASVEFVPEGLVPYATSVRVTVAAGLKALDGAVLEQPYTFEFETPRPRVQSISPDKGFAWLPAEPTFTLLVDQPVRELEASAHLLVGDEARRVALRVVREVDVAEELRAAQPTPRHPRQGFAERGFKNRQTRYELSPAEKLPPGAPVTLVVPAGLLSKEGPLPMTEEFRADFRTYGPLSILEARACARLWSHEDFRCPYGPIVLRTSNELDPKSLRERLTITPAVAIDWDAVEAAVPPSYADHPTPYVVLVGRWIPGTRYELRLDAGVTDVFGQVAGAFSGTVELDDVEPYVKVGSRLALLEAGGDGALPLESVNVDEIEAEIWPLGPAELARLLGTECRWGDEACARPAGRSVKARIPTGGTENIVRYFPLPLRPSLGKPTGLFHVRVRAPSIDPATPTHTGPTYRPVTGQLTDLAVHAKLGARSGLVWVTSLSTGAPVPQAIIAMYDASGRETFRGTTDADGLARVPALTGEGSSWRTPFALVAAEKGGDIGVTVSRWQDGVSPGAFGLAADWEDAEPVSLGTVFTDRGIYRPGDEVFLKGLLRYRRLGELATPPSGTVRVTVTDSRERQFFQQEVPLSRFGTLDARLQLEKEVPLGTYWIAVEGKLDGQPLRLGASFRVEEYRAPQFRVDVTATNEELASGDNLGATVLARYLFGGAMSGADARWTVSREVSDFSPPEHDSFAFGARTWLWDDDGPQPFSDVFGAGDGKIDTEGKLAIDAGTAETPGDKPWSYTIEAEVTDVNRQRVANRATVTVHPAEVYAGLRLATEGFVELGKPARLEAVAVSPRGERRAGQALSVELRRREWKSIRKKGVGDRYFTVTEAVEEKVHTCELRSETTAVACDYTPTAPGLYLAEAVVRDEKGRKQVTTISFYVVGGGWVSWQRNDTDRVDLVPDRARYDLGQTAKILVKSPYPEADAVITVEREGVLESRRVRLTGSAQAIELPITEAMIPNVYVGVVIARGRVAGDRGLEQGDDPGRPAVRVGYTELQVEKRSKRLDVSVKPDATDKRPRDRVKVELAVTDVNGKGAPAELVVWAVDEGVLRLTDYQKPDPVEAVHRHRGLSVRLAEPLVHLVLRQFFGDKGRSAGGSGGGEALGGGFRSRFKTTALFAPQVRTDEQGRATVEFELPDNLTTFRIMAVAVTEGDRFGAGQAEIAVWKPLLALPALPRLARVGDTFEAGVVVHTKGAVVPEATVTAQVEGLRIDGPAEEKVALQPGAPREVRFRFVAEQPGQATLRFAVTGGGERDGVEEKLPIQLPVAMEAVATYGDTRDERVEGIVPPSGVRPGVGGLQLTLASTVLGGFDQGMRQLVEYPYGCLEQKASKLVPFIALRELSGKFGLPWDASSAEARREYLRRWIPDEAIATAGATDPDELIRATVRDLEALQSYDGGYRYWPTASCSADWASAYAVLALGRAKEVGYPVDAAAFARGQAFLADKVAANECLRCWGGCEKPGDVTRIFALYTLARTGKPKASYYGELFARRATLPLFAKAMLADAMWVGGGDRGQARQLLDELLTHARESPRELHFEETDPGTYATTWSSDTRTTAIVLQTLTTIAPDHPFVAKLGAYLNGIRGKDGHFRNTQEASFSLMALADVVRTKEREVPDFTARVLLGGRELAQAPFSGRSTRVEPVSVPIDALSSGGAQPQPLTFRKDGPGVLYYGALLRYAPAELPTTPLERGIVVQRWFEPYAGGGQARQFYAGDLVRVRVRVGSSMERNFVAIEVPLPAGLEPVDTSLASTARLPALPAEEGPGEGYEYESAEDLYGEGEVEDEFGPWASAFYSPFNHSEQRDDRVVFFADRLPPGVHVASFVARATTPGDFVLKPAQAEEMYAPEVFGRSDGGRLQVVDPSEVAAR